MLISSEIVEMVQNYTSDRKEQVFIINELKEAIKHNPKRLCADLEEEAEDIADGDFCPLCESNITYETHMQESQYFGQPTHEYITIGRCENDSCNYTTED